MTLPESWRNGNKGDRSQFRVGPQDLLPATSPGWHKQGSFRGPLGKMMETETNETKTLRNLLAGISPPLAVRRELNPASANFDFQLFRMSCIARIKKNIMGKATQILSIFILGSRHP